MATLLGPGEDNLCGGGANAAGNLLDDLVLDEKGLADHVVTESLSGVSICQPAWYEQTYGVLGDVNVLLLAVLDELWLEETRVTLNLVGSGSDTSAVNEGLEVLLCVVGDTNSTPSRGKRLLCTSPRSSKATGKWTR